MIQCSASGAPMSLAPPSAALPPSGLRTSPEDSDQKLAALLRWLEDRGARFPKLHIVRRERSCVLMRREEKRLLRAWLELTRTGLSLLRTPRAELERLAERSGSPWGWFDRDVREAVLEFVRAPPRG